MASLLPAITGTEAGFDGLRDSLITGGQDLFAKVLGSALTDGERTIGLSSMNKKLKIEKISKQKNCLFKDQNAREDFRR